MIFSHDRTKLRKFYQDCWSKFKSNQQLTELEQQIVEVISEHPEYEKEVTTNSNLSNEWFPEQGVTNPFLHLGMHLAIREQLTIDQPAGIRSIVKKILKKNGNPHEVEHKMMDCLAEVIWLSQKNNQEPDLKAYISCLKKL